MVFQNRQEAGKKLASQLIRYLDQNPIILALPRGGMPIGFEIAQVLRAPLDILVVRKIGFSGNSEFGIGAIAEGGVKVLDQKTIAMLGIDDREIDQAVKLEEDELKRRVKIYRGGKPLPNLKNRLVILVDDGMATGLTAQAAIKTVKKSNPKKIIFVAPVCARETVEGLKATVDKVFCLAAPDEFMAVGAWYKDFEQLSDEQVVNLLEQARIIL